MAVGSGRARGSSRTHGLRPPARAGDQALDEDTVETELTAIAEGARSFADLRAGDLVGRLLARTGEHRGSFERIAPTHVPLAGGRRVRVHYEPDQPPWIESRLQDFFGSTKGPTVADGRVPVAIRLLAPNQRPVQITTDLAGFWERHYADIRKALMRKYPRHEWPEIRVTRSRPFRSAAEPASAPQRRGDDA